MAVSFFSPLCSSNGWKSQVMPLPMYGKLNAAFVHTGKVQYEYDTQNGNSNPVMESIMSRPASCHITQTWNIILKRNNFSHVFFCIVFLLVGKISSYFFYCSLYSDILCEYMCNRPLYGSPLFQSAVCFRECDFKQSQGKSA